MGTVDKQPLTIVGLGPGTWNSLTIEASMVLKEATDVYVRTSEQPRLSDIERALPDVTFHSFDYLYESLPSLPDVYEHIVQEIFQLAGRPGGVVYAVPGSPAIGETTVRLLLQRATEAGLGVRLIQGLGFIEPALAALGITDSSWVEIIDAGEAARMGSENAVGEIPGDITLIPWRSLVPTSPMLISQLYDRDTATGVKLWLGRFYPDEHVIHVVHAAGSPRAVVDSMPLYELDRLPTIDHETALYVPPLTDLENVRTFAGLMHITRRLRGPGGCPWDREQTHASLKTYLLEEAYEVIEALDSGDAEMLAEEMGDLLYQITIHSQVAAEAGEFTIEDVIQNIVCKMIGRHPHVFGELQLDSAQDVRQAWEGFKQRQKPMRASVMEGIPGGLPALPQSNLMQKRAASIGFEWPSVTEVIAKVDEELNELRMEIDGGGAKDLQREELGDILFALVSVARHLRIDPEEALRLANQKFRRRFRHVESRAAGSNRALRDLSHIELDEYWNEAKAEAK